MLVTSRNLHLPALTFSSQFTQKMLQLRVKHTGPPWWLSIKIHLPVQEVESRPRTRRPHAVGQPSSVYTSTELRALQVPCAANTKPKHLGPMLTDSKRGHCNVAPQWGRKPMPLLEEAELEPLAHSYREPEQGPSRIYRNPEQPAHKQLWKPEQQ